jgi:hypothetical protein
MNNFYLILIITPINSIINLNLIILFFSNLYL